MDSKSKQLKIRHLINISLLTALLCLFSCGKSENIPIVTWAGIPSQASEEAFAALKECGIDGHLGLYPGLPQAEVALDAAQKAGLWLIPGFVAGLLALKYKWTDAVMRWIHKDRMLQFFALAFFFLVSMDARLFTFAVAFALTIDFSFFYPSERIIKMAESDNRALLSMSNEEIRNIYF